MTPECSKPLAIIPTGTLQRKAALPLADYRPRDHERGLWLAGEPCADNRPLRAPFVLFSGTQLCNNLVINSVDTRAVLQPNRRCLAKTRTNHSTVLDHVTSASLGSWNLRDGGCILFKSPCNEVPRAAHDTNVTYHVIVCSVTWSEVANQRADQDRCTEGGRPKRSY